MTPSCLGVVATVKQTLVQPDSTFPRAIAEELLPHVLLQSGHQSSHLATVLFHPDQQLAGHIWCLQEFQANYQVLTYYDEC